MQLTATMSDLMSGRVHPKLAGIHLLNYHSFRHTQPFTFLDKSTASITAFVVQALSCHIVNFVFTPTQ